MSIQAGTEQSGWCVMFRRALTGVQKDVGLPERCSIIELAETPDVVRETSTTFVFTKVIYSTKVRVGGILIYNPRLQKIPK